MFNTTKTIYVKNYYHFYLLLKKDTRNIDKIFVID